MLQITDYCPQGVAVMHGEFQGWGFSGIGRFLGVGAAVVDGMGMFDHKNRHFHCVLTKENERIVL